MTPIVSPNGVLYGTEKSFVIDGKAPSPVADFHCQRAVILMDGCEDRHRGFNCSRTVSLFL